MRFNRNFHEYQLPDWSSHYVDYPAFKKILTDFDLQQPSRGAERDVHAFIQTLVREISKVERFYASQYETFRSRALLFLRQTEDNELLDVPPSTQERISHLKPEEYAGALLQLLESLQKLHWFGYVNHVAFQRILSKSQSLRPYGHREHKDKTLLEDQNFAHQRGCLQHLQRIKYLLNDLLGSNRAIEPLSSRFQDLTGSLTGSSLSSTRSMLKSSTYVRTVYNGTSNAGAGIDHGELLQSLGRLNANGLDERDRLGRLPLHYAAEIGILEQCRHYLHTSARKPRSDQLDPSDAILAADIEGMTPLHLSIIRGHVEITDFLVDNLRMQDKAGHSRQNNRLSEILGPLLHLATRLGFSIIATALIDNGANIYHSGAHGETALHIAAQMGNDTVTKALIRAPSGEAIIDLRETFHGRTALLIACIQGHKSVVDLLIKHGANTDSRDHLGWTANDHAGFRGYLTMFRCIETRDNPTVDKIGKTPRPLLWRPAPAESPPWLPPTQKRCDTSQGQILVSLGVSNTRSSAKAIDLNMMQWCEENGLRCQAGFALEIDVIGGYGPRRLVVLPVLVDMTNQPIVFSSTDPHEAKIVFRLFEVCDYRKPDLSLVGSGVAILKTLQERLSPKHESLVRDHTIPILAKDTLDMVASVVFSFLIVNPFAHTPLSTTATHGFWRSDGQTAVVGHRGSGANTASRTTLQIGENTLQSFLSAVASGASCIEFDVQLTKDLIPVVFHDFLVMETGGDVPLHTLTRDQFIHFSSNQRFRSDQLGNAGRGYRQATEGLNGAGLRARSYSENLDDVDLVGEIRQRMRYTEEGLKDEVRGNLRGYSIQEPSTTLEELLMQLPASVSFNLEMKYPMLWEAEDRDMDVFAIELNLFVDTILNMVYRLAGKRNITFSSFSPEICILLSVKQQIYPVLFINKAGSVPTGDIRASNLQQAIHFAKAWNLAGIVMLSDIFVLCPHLLRYAKSRGLVCGSYGNLNDDPVNAKIQAEAGLDAIIVNKVRLISQTLTDAAH